MTTQHGDQRIIRAATDDGYWVQEFDISDCFWHSVKFTQHADVMTEQARTTALAQVYAAVATLMESPGNHADALTALDMVVTALSRHGDDYATYVAIEQEQPS